MVEHIQMALMSQAAEYTTVITYPGQSNAVLKIKRIVVLLNFYVLANLLTKRSHTIDILQQYKY